VSKIKPAFLQIYKKKIKKCDPQRKFLVQILGVSLYMKKNRFFSKKNVKKSQK
jgi:hypothetical protein